MEKIKELKIHLKIIQNILERDDEFEHFDDLEFFCKCGKCNMLPENGVSPEFKKRLEKVREISNAMYGNYEGRERRLHITKNGGYRCAPHQNKHAPKDVDDWNRDCGGAAKSKHKVLDENGQLCAADIWVDGLTPNQLFAITNIIFFDGGVGVGNTINHVDYDGSGKRRRWTY